jgi:hypothetical protein
VQVNAGTTSTKPNENSRFPAENDSTNQLTLEHPGGLGVEIRAGTGGVWLCSFQQQSTGGEYAVFVSRSIDGVPLSTFFFFTFCFLS